MPLNPVYNIATGETTYVEEPEVPYVPPGPASVKMAQARIALHRAGLLPQVEAALESLPEPARTEAKIQWEFEPEVVRGSTLVQGLMPALGLSETQVDDLFRAAAQI